jgi:replicative superfamily II helicase
MDAPDPDLASEYRFPSDRHPYSHQLRTWELLSAEAKKSAIVTSGTGSGKTECFLVPILNRLIQEHSSVGEPLIGVRALFLYPLNALINSQRDRLKAWTYGLKDSIRFSLYNGMTPEALPVTQAQIGCELRDRKTLRKTPPPILVTNATMLEYMLVRAQDAPILEASKGKLEWIILDEAHTYIGSQAAELALLIRRVLHAFGVKPQDVRFVATSATIGDSNGAALTQLREFLARVSGNDIERIHVVSGERTIPILPPIKSSAVSSMADLRALGEGVDTIKSLYSALVNHPVARSIRQQFTPSNSAPVAKLSVICSTVFGASDMYTRASQNEGLKWLDLLTSAIDVNGTPFLPLRSHIFHQTLPGLWCCADRSCPAKLGSRLDHAQWPFGTLYLEPRKFCSCGSPVFELIACQDCGAIYLHAEVNGNRLVQPETDSTSDEFALDVEDDSAEEVEQPPFELTSGRSLLLVTNRDLPDSGLIHVSKVDGTIVETVGTQVLTIIGHELGPEGLICPECTKKASRFGELFRTARVGAPFYLAGALPNLLEFALDGDHPAEHTYRGRRLLTFTDSRQGTARLAARLQQDAERTKARGLIYHNLLARPLLNGNTEEQIRALENLTEPSFAITNLLNDLRRQAQQASMAGLRQLQLGVQQRGVDFDAIRAQYQSYSRDLFGGANGPANVAEALLLRELGRRPKRQNNLETMGLVAVCYPKLLNLTSVPPIWMAKNRSDRDWRDFLKLALDYVVRNGGSLEIRDEMWPWLGMPQRRTAIVAAATEEVNRFQRRWPSVRRSGRNSLLVRIVEEVLKVDTHTLEGQDVVDAVLDAAWLAVRNLLKLTANGYVLPLEEIAFRPINEAWICPFTRRLLDTTLCGISPYLPRRIIQNISCCERVDIPVYDSPFGGGADGDDPVRRGRAWIEKQPAIQSLREEGLWSIFNDRVIEFAMYYTAVEHSAQQSSTKLQEYEKKFKEGRINILSCSTTMEMGIDIGGVQQVAMNNVPPHPANYLQRAGRAGRRSETRSTALTLCKANPHDQNVFLNTRWAFDTVLPAPVVSLNSAIIVQRHINSVVLSRFLKVLLSTQRQEIHKLTCGSFFLGAVGVTPAENLATWCDGYSQGTDNPFEEGLTQLIRHTIFEGRSIRDLLMPCSSSLRRATEMWLREWDALLEQEARVGMDTTDPAFKAIAFQKSRLANEYLLRELATNGFLPAYGFPSNVASFDNLTISGVRNLAPAQSNGLGESNRYFRRELPSRDLVTALREYAPGAEIVLDGLVYRSAGITLNWHIPASEADARETQAIKFAWWCRRCGSSGTSVVLARNCDACGSDLSEYEKFLEPAGFSVDFYEDPHNNVTLPTYVPVEAPIISARGEWAPLPNPDLGRHRTATDGRVYHHSRGVNGTGYAICLACGRAEPNKTDGELPEIFTRAGGHQRLRSKKGERLCPGSSNRWAITKVALGHESRTDMLEIQLRDVTGQPLGDYSTALTIAVAIRDALADLLGVQSAELGCDAREVRNGDGTRCHSIFVFDHYAAGYSSGAERLLPQIFHKAVDILTCPKSCDSSCPNCILDFDQRFEAGSLDRYAALRFLSPSWLKMLTLPEDLEFFGKSSRVETLSISGAVLRESSTADAGTARLYMDGTDNDFSASAIRNLAYRLLSMSRSVTVVFAKATLSQLSEADRFSLAAIAEHPGASVCVVEKLSEVGEAVVVADVEQSNGCVAWACLDKNVVHATTSWGMSSSPLIRGTMSPSNPGILCKSSSLRPPAAIGGDVEISIQHHVDGEISTFGVRLWRLVCHLHAPTKILFAHPFAKIASITYSDRYLFTPLMIAILQQVLVGLKELLGDERFDHPELVINTTALRPQGQKNLGTYVFSDWPSTQVRNAVADLVLSPLGTLKLNSSEKLQHSRLLTIVFTTGEVLALRLDQGVGYWRVPNWSRTGTKWFDFANQNTSAQAKAVMDMGVWIEGQVAPTQVFVKLREAKGKLP